MSELSVTDGELHRDAGVPVCHETQTFREESWEYLALWNYITKRVFGVATLPPEFGGAVVSKYISKGRLRAMSREYLGVRSYIAEQGVMEAPSPFIITTQVCYLMLNPLPVEHAMVPMREPREMMYCFTKRVCSAEASIYNSNRGFREMSRESVEMLSFIARRVSGAIVLLKLFRVCAARFRHWLRFRRCRRSRPWRGEHSMQAEAPVLVCAPPPPRPSAAATGGHP